MGFDAFSFCENSDSLIEVLWADDKINPTRTYMGAVPDDGVQAHSSEKPKVVIWPPTLRTWVYFDHSVPQTFFNFPN